MSTLAQQQQQYNRPQQQPGQQQVRQPQQQPLQRNNMSFFPDHIPTQDDGPFSSTRNIIVPNLSAWLVQDQSLTSQ